MLFVSKILVGIALGFTLVGVVPSIKVGDFQTIGVGANALAHSCPPGTQHIHFEGEVGLCIRTADGEVTGGENIDGITPMSCYDYKRMAEALTAMQESLESMGVPLAGLCAVWGKACPFIAGGSALLWLYLEAYIWLIEPEEGECEA